MTGKNQNFERSVLTQENILFVEAGGRGGPINQSTLSRRTEPQDCNSGVYKVLIHFPRGEFIKSVGAEFQVVKRGRKYHGCGEAYEYIVEKRERGSIIVIFPIILRLLNEKNHDLKII